MKTAKHNFRTLEFVKGGKVKMASYPWDKCIADMKDQGKSEEVANKICGAIKAGTAG